MSITTEEDVVFTWTPSGSSGTCVKAFNSVVTNTLQDGMTVVGTPITTSDSETLSNGDQCCLEGVRITD